MRRPLTVVSALALLVASTGTAAQAAPRGSRVALTIAASSPVAKVSSVEVITGLSTPPLLASVSLQVAVDGKWTTVGHAKTTSTGAYTLGYRGPKTPQTIEVRVTRPATKTTAFVASKGLHLVFVATKFAVTASASSTLLGNGSPLTVTGDVSPSTKGSVYLQLLDAKGVWSTTTKATLDKNSHYAVSTVVAQGSPVYRVLRPSTSTVASGTSPLLHLTVASPALTSTPALAMKVGIGFSTTLTASGGAAPYQFSAFGLPAGLLLHSTGTITGAPAVAGTSTATVTVSDANGFSSSTAVQIVVAPVSGKVWGAGGSGALGTGATTSSPTPVASLIPSNVKAFSAGAQYALALTWDGHVYSWGLNSSGQLGDGNLTSSSMPVRTPLTDIVAISAGLDSAYALDGLGHVWAWGNNAHGQLGDGTTTSSPTPTQVSQVFGVVEIAAGSGFVLGRDDTGRVRAWGDGESGTLGNNTTVTTQGTAVTVQGIDGSVGHQAVAISAGWYDGYAVLSDGSVLAWGSSVGGALGNSNVSLMSNALVPGPVVGLTGVKSLACNGSLFCLALKADGTVQAWGDNGAGELANGTLADSWTAAPVAGLSGVTAIASGGASGYALTATGTVYSWGSNSNGEAGNGLAGNLTHASLIPGLTGVLSIAGGVYSAYAVVAS